MNDIRYKNLYDALTSQIDYCSYIEQYGYENVNLENIHFDLLETIYGSFLLTLLMDDYFIKNDFNKNSILIPEVIKLLAKLVSSYNGKEYIIGDLKYYDENIVLEKIRNKLAHGDFIVKDGNIIFEDNKLEGRISIENLMQLVYNLGEEIQKCTLNTSYKKVFNKIIKEFNVKKITSIEEFDEACNNLYRIEIIDIPVVPTNRNSKHVRIRKLLHEILEINIDKFSLSYLEQYLKKVESELKKYGFQIKYSIKNIKTLDYYQNIKEKYMSMIELYKDLSFTSQINAINHIAYIFGNGKYQKADIKKGIQLNLWLMEKIRQNPEHTLIELLKENKNIAKLILYHYDTAILCSYLVGFNALYEYGLEKGLTQKGNYNLISIFEGKSLDFSKLELDEFYDPNMKIEHVFDKYLEDVENYENKELKTIEISIKKIQNKINQYVNNCKNLDESKISEFQHELLELEKLKFKLENKIEKIKKFLNDFDLNKYTRNFNIITHIRNAIAHGNVFIDSYATDIIETDIIFEDKYKGEVSYQKKIKMKDFIWLFHTTNIKNLYTCITNNINNKVLIDENYYDDMIDRWEGKTKN